MGNKEDRYSLYERALVSLPAIIREMGDRERRSDRKYQLACGVLAGVNLAAGNIPGWVVCTGLAFIPTIRRWIGK